MYGEDGGLGGEGDGSVRARGGWGNIIKVGSEMDKVGLNFTSSFRRRVGNGEDTRFWLDRWVGEFRLCDRFPRLFNLEGEKSATVKERGDWRTGAWVWVWDWRGNPRGRSLGELDDLKNMLSESSPGWNSMDTWSWAMGGNGEFSVKALK